MRQGDATTIQPCQRVRSSRVVPCQATQALDLATAARNHPTARQQDSAACRVFPPDALQRHPVVPRRRCRVLAGITLRRRGPVDRFACATRHVLHQRTRLRTVLRLGNSALDGKQTPSGSPPRWDLLPCDHPPASAEAGADARGGAWLDPLGHCVSRVTAFSCVYRRHIHHAQRCCCATAVCVQRRGPCATALCYPALRPGWTDTCCRWHQTIRHPPSAAIAASSPPTAENSGTQSPRRASAANPTQGVDHHTHSGWTLGRLGRNHRQRQRANGPCAI